MYVVEPLPQFAWDDAFELGHDEMDGTHREFVTCVDAMLQAADEDQATALAAFAAHARRHFADEDRWMAQASYGNAGCHVDEHAAVLKSLHEVGAALASGRHGVVRSFARALVDWFPEHAQVMDQGLARFLVERRLGGAPVVIRRGKASST
jgi:hemerythrin